MCFERWSVTLIVAAAIVVIEDDVAVEVIHKSHRSD